MPSPVDFDARLSRALAHPLRQRILLALGGRIASPSELALELGALLGDVSYHTKQLHAFDCLELVRTEKRRGATIHFYTTTRGLLIEDAEWRAFAPAERRRMAERVLEEIVLDTTRASREGGVEHEEVHISRMPLELDAQGHDAVRRLLRDVVDRVLAIQAESAARQGADTHPASEPARLSILYFPT